MKNLKPSEMIPPNNPYKQRAIFWGCAFEDAVVTFGAFKNSEETYAE